jgi:hypothetical protein
MSGHFQLLRIPVPLTRTWAQSWKVPLVTWSSRVRLQRPLSSSQRASTTLVLSFMYFLEPCLSAKSSK